MTLTRRSWAALTAAGALGAAPHRFRYAICSETFAGSNIDQACRAAKRTGYEGIEIDPAQLSGDPASLPPGERSRIRRMMADEGIAYAGLHSFLRAPAGLHLTTADAAVRERSWTYFRRMIDLAADLGPKPVLVLGSSRQRMTIGTVTPAEASERLREGLSVLAPAAAARGVTILLEPLAPHLCNVVTTLAEAIRIVQAVNSPAVQTMFDTHNTAAETKPPGALIRHYAAFIRHVHLNEMDGRRPGLGDYPFREVIRTLREIRFPYWVSVEVFDFEPDGETVAREAREFLRRLEVP